MTKFDHDGALLWTKQLGAETFPNGESDGMDQCNSMTVDNSGNIYCAGFTTGSLGGENVGTEDALILKLNNLGSIDWIKQLGSFNGDECYGVAVDTSNNVYCAGSTFGAIVSANDGGTNIFVVKLKPDGSL